MRPSWIECRRKHSRVHLTVRIRADFVTAVMETMTKVGTKEHQGVLIQLGNNNHVNVVDETVDSVWNKVLQALGTNMPLITEASPDYPGHPDYGKREAA